MLIGVDDFAPRALRFAIVDLATNWTFQLIILDSSKDPEVTPFPDNSPARMAVINTFAEMSAPKLKDTIPYFTPNFSTK